MIDGYASQPHYLRHLQPIWQALPAEMMGAVYVGLNVNELGPYGTYLGLPVKKGRPPGNGHPLLVAGGSDLVYYEARPVVFVEHGVGQSYQGISDVSYSGGIGRTAVRLFLCPNEQAAAANRASYPDTPAVVVGCPTVQPATRNIPAGADRHERNQAVIGISWHWDSTIVPETRSSWPYWAGAALHLASHRRVVGHAHPKIAREILPWWTHNRVPNTPHWHELDACCDVYVTDNSSTLYEFAASGRPVVVLDAPWYRRDVEHGLRFWDAADVGIRIGDPAELADAVDLAVEDPAALQAARADAVARVCPTIGTAAAAAAAAAIMTLMVKA